MGPKMLSIHTSVFQQNSNEPHYFLQCCANVKVIIMTLTLAALRLDNYNAQRAEAILMQGH